MSEFEDCEYLQALAQEFILTAMIWGAAVAFIIDKKATSAMLALFTGSILSLFGVIHSATPEGKLYLPWLLDDPKNLQIPYKFAVSYAMLGIFVLLLMKFSMKPKDGDAH